MDRESLFQTFGNRRLSRLESDLAHRVTEELAVFGHVDGVTRRTDQLAIELLEHALAHEIERRVERGLTTHRRQHRIRALLLDDAGDGAPIDRFDVGRIGHAGVGHDRGGIRVHQNDPVALLS